MACEFNVTGDIEKARQIIEANKGEMIGGAWHGTFKGQGVEGEYQLLAGSDKYLVTIHKKPWIVSCAYIEKRISEHFAVARIKKSLWQKVRGLFQ